MPAASRPDIPGYGIASSTEGEGLLPWSWAEERLVASKGYWIATTRPDGRPHVTPVWAVWHEDAAWFSTDGRAKVANLTAEPRCTITTESTTEAVIVDGAAELIASRPAPVAECYRAKYGLSPPADSPLYRIEPRVVFGFIDDEERFATTATRWTF